MNRLWRVLAFAGLTAAATWAVSWWMVPAVAALQVRVAPDEPAPVAGCMVGAGLAWAILLGWGALHGPMDTVARRVGAVLDLSAWGFVAATLLFAALLAGAAAWVAKPSRAG